MIGCAGACGYMSAAPRIGVRPQQVIDTRRAFQKQNAQLSTLHAPWLWTSIIPGSSFGGTWTYLDYYTTVANQYNTAYGDAALYGFAVPPITMQQMIQQKFATPQDAFQQWVIYCNKTPKDYLCEFLSTPDGPPTIVSQQFEEFWLWFLEQVTGHKKCPKGQGYNPYGQKCSFPIK